MYMCTLLYEGSYETKFYYHTGPFKRLGVNSSSDDETGRPPLLSVATHKFTVCRRAQRTTIQLFRFEALLFHVPGPCVYLYIFGYICLYMLCVYIYICIFGVEARGLSL